MQRRIGRRRELRLTLSPFVKYLPDQRQDRLLGIVDAVFLAMKYACGQQ